MKRLSYRPRRAERGMTLLEAAVSIAIIGAVSAGATQILTTGIRTFARNESQTYVQFRGRTAMEQISSDARAACALLPSTTVRGTTFTSSDGSDPAKPAVLILQVPAQDEQGMFYYGASDQNDNPYPAPNTLVMDTIVYRYDPAEKAVYRTIQPARDILTNKGDLRSSNRPADTDVMAVRNMGQFRLTFRDAEGNVTAMPTVHTASVDINTSTSIASHVAGDNGVAQVQSLSTGMRMRNMRDGTVYGRVKLKNGLDAAGTTVAAIYVEGDGYNTLGSVINSGIVDSTGFFEVNNLDDGTYNLKVTTTTGVVQDLNQSIQVKNNNSVNVGMIVLH